MNEMRRLMESLDRALDEDDQSNPSKITADDVKNAHMGVVDDSKFLKALRDAIRVEAEEENDMTYDQYMSSSSPFTPEQIAQSMQEVDRYYGYDLTELKQNDLPYLKYLQTQKQAENR